MWSAAIPHLRTLSSREGPVTASRHPVQSLQYTSPASSARACDPELGHLRRYRTIHTHTHTQKPSLGPGLVPYSNPSALTG